MSNVYISRKHHLDHEECVAVARELLDKLVGKYGGRVKPDGENFCYRHATGMTAVVEPGANVLDIKNQI